MTLGPSDIWLIKEQDIAFAGSNNNFPDPTDNHGAAGDHVLFVDGHVEFVLTPKYLMSYEVGQDEGVAPGRPSTK